MFASYIDFIAAVGLSVMFFYMLSKHSSTWLHRSHIGNIVLAAVWPLCQYSIAASGVPDVQYMITTLVYVSVIVLAHNWLLFVLRISPYPQKLHNRIRLPLLVPTVIVLAALIWEPAHELFIARTVDKKTIMEFGPLFWWCLFYMFSYLMAALVIAIVKLLTAPPYKRAPLIAVLVGCVSYIALGSADVYYNVIIYPQYGVVPGLTSLGLLIITGCFSIPFFRGEWVKRAEATHLEEIHAKHMALLERNEQLKQLSATDELTGCYNRRFFRQHLLREIDIERRHKTVFSILLIDVDNFKLINDTYGHATGDEILIQLSEAIRGTLRKSDVLARIGGEEFTIYLPHTSMEAAVVMADRIRQVVLHERFVSRKGEVPVTVSIGVSSASADDQQRENPHAYLDELMERADIALYKAKAEGRNRIVSAEPNI